MNKTPTALIIMDGFGISAGDSGNAVRAANTPCLDRFFREFAHTELSASGLDVGLPDGQMGNSEVGHTNIGGGRVVFQDLPRITKSIADGDFFTNPAYNHAMDACLEKGTALHLMGLMSDGGVHSHLDHLFALLKLAKDKGYDLSAVAATGYNGVIVARDVDAHVGGPHVKTSPVAAKMAAELGVDVASIGADGQRVMKADVLAAVTPAAAAAPVEEADEVIKVTPMRRAIAKNMENSWHTSPRVTFTRPFDATAMKDLRKALNKSLESKGIKVSYNHIIMKVVSMCLRDYPDINGSFADNMLTHHKHINMGLAVAQPSGGLGVPNVKDCDKKSLAEIAVEADQLAKDGKSGKLGIDAMKGGTFTITNLGNYGLTNFSPIINQPELAILGVCAMIDTPVVRDGQIVVRPMMNLCLTADHRVIDGVQAAEFLQKVCEMLENPVLLLA